MEHSFRYRFIDRTEQLVQRIDANKNQWVFMVDDESDPLWQAWKNTQPLPEIERYSSEQNYYNP